MRTPSFSLSGKVGVVTGATRGIGRALADGLAAAGALVVVTGRDAAALADVEQAIIAAGARAASQILDVADPASINQAFAEIAARHGRIDILVNNAGVEEVRPSLEVTEPLWDRILGTNLKGAFFCAQAAAKHMSDGGSILNLCSLTSEVGVPGAAPYGASKSGLAGLTRTLATEWAERGIRVNGIGPGYFRTALTEGFYESDEWQQSMLAKIPMRRFGQLEDLIGAAVFLCSDAAAYITGQILYVDGGYLAAI
jgi:NAD(P)-dependent dehydrogenase (short-subunit alcohol dehydrogenase family)